MTKTLTEQWREGTLRGCFYWKLPNGNICTAYTDTIGDIKAEVLQEAPSYYEYKELVSKTEQLEKKLEIATKALKGVSLWANTGNGGEKAVKKVCEKALKEMEGVK